MFGMNKLHPQLREPCMDVDEEEEEKLRLFQCAEKSQITDVRDWKLSETPKRQY